VAKNFGVSICEHLVKYKLPKTASLADVKLYLSQNYASKRVFVAGKSRKLVIQGDLPAIADTANIVVLSEHSQYRSVVGDLQRRADRHKQIIIAPTGFIARKKIQGIYVITPGQKPVLTEKISFDMEDQVRVRAGKQRRGQVLHIFDTPIGRFSVLDCHDYTHSDLINILLSKELEFLIVTANNTASRLFREYALSDMHHFFGYIILNNIANIGGSGVYAPIAKLRDNKISVNISGTLFEAAGPSYAASLISLYIEHLRGTREAYLDADDPVKVEYSDPDTGEHTPILPPESFTIGSPHYRKVLAGKDPVKTIDIDKEGYRFSGKLNKVTVTVAQLFAPDMNAYLETSYRPSTARDVPGKLRGKRFISEIRARLREFDRRQAIRKSHFLLLPEVFLPESLENEIRKLVRKHNVIVLSGLEYTPQAKPSLVGKKHAKGANRSRIYIPAKGSVVERTYLKMTRSQYDARWRERGDKEDYPFEMTLGTELLRFKSASGVNFGILVCYDISHFEIINRINEAGPLDVLFVLSHNPYAELYRNICLASSHRFYQYVVMCNVAEYGGSGVFGPLRTRGTRRTLGYLGQNTEAVIDVGLDIEALRVARRTSDEKLTPEKSTFQRKPGRYQIRLKPTKNVVEKQ
jgi:predicted amidohydrolase